MAIRQIIGGCLALTLSLSTAMAAEFIGVTAALKGEVLRLGSTEPSASIGALSSGEKIFLGDDIKVGETGRLQVLLVDETVFTLGAGAEMTIDKFVYDPNQTNELAANIKKGAFRFVSGKVAKAGKDAMKVTVPGATIAVRGTQVAGLIDEGGQADIVLLGPGPNSFGATPGSIAVFNELGSADVLRGGYSINVAPNEPPGEVQQVDPELLKRVENAVSELASEEIAETIADTETNERTAALNQALTEKGVSGTTATNDVEILRFISEEEAQMLADDGLNFDAEAVGKLAKYAELNSLATPPPGPSVADLAGASFQGSRQYSLTGVQMTATNGDVFGTMDLSTTYNFDADQIQQVLSGQVEGLKINNTATADFSFAFNGTGNISNMTTLGGTNEARFIAGSEHTDLSAVVGTPTLTDVTMQDGNPPVNKPNTFTGTPVFTLTNWSLTGTAAANDTLLISTSGGLATIDTPGDLGFTNTSIVTANGATEYHNVAGTGVAAGQSQ